MNNLKIQFADVKKYASFLLLPFICVLILTCGTDSTPVNPPATNSGVPLRILGPTGQATVLSGSINSSNPGDFKINGTVLTATGGSPISGYSWSLSNLSSYPSGTTVDALTGLFKWSGSNTTVPAGSYPFKMTVSDGSSTAEGSYIFVLTSYSIPPTLLFQQPGNLTFRLDTAIAGKSYGSSLFIMAGSSGPNSNNIYLPLKWELATGVLPAGLVIDQHTGIVRGTPMSSATNQDYTFTIKVTNQNNEVASCPGGCIEYEIYVR